jgi:hypothetical protein
MKRYFLFALIASALLAGCSLGGIGQPPATVTPQPTNTSLPPTETPLPSATATFLPSPTPLPSATPTADNVTPTVAATPTSSQLQGVLAFGANLREGPGTQYDSLDTVDAGDVVTILGRDQDGRWLFVRTSSGQEGWIAVQQFEGPVDLPRIPLAEGIPTPNATQAAAASSTPRITGTPGTPQATATGGTTDPNYFTLNPGATPICRTFTVATAGDYHVTSTTGDIKPFNTTDPASVSEQDAYQFDRSTVPTFIDVKVDGNAKPAQCDDASKTCKQVTFKICAGAGGDAPTGGTEYVRDVIVKLGTQSFDQFFQETTATLKLTFKVVAP